MEGRDIGTVVFPNAFCKIFLTASVEERATRRLNQLKQSGDVTHSLEEIKRDVIQRDEQDMNRAVAPLKQADDAVLLDTSDLTYDQVIQEIVKIIQNKASELQIQI
jgi:cytidylate kinase